MVLKIWWNSVRKANSERTYYLLRTRDTGDIANSAIPQIFKMNNNNVSFHHNDPHDPPPTIMIHHNGLMFGNS